MTRYTPLGLGRGVLTGNYTCVEQLPEGQSCVDRRMLQTGQQHDLLEAASRIKAQQSAREYYVALRGRLGAEPRIGE